MNTKICNKCQISQPLDNFSHFFEKQRNRFRISTHCKSCAALNTKKYYYANREKCIENAKRWKLNNFEYIKKVKKEINIRYVNDLHITYVMQCLRRGKLSDDFINKNPQVIETKRLQIKLTRKLKELKNGTKQIK